MEVLLLQHLLHFHIPFRYMHGLFGLFLTLLFQLCGKALDLLFHILFKLLGIL